MPPPLASDPGQSHSELEKQGLKTLNQAGIKESRDFKVRGTIQKQ